MMPDTCTLNTRIAHKKNSLKVMNVIEVVQMLVDKSVKCLLNPKC